MSADLYPVEVWNRFQNPQHVLPLVASANLLAELRTPASQEEAALYAYSGRWFWRAHASPWLVATLEGVCQLGEAATVAELDEALNSLEIPPIKRYCAVLARELFLQAQSAGNSDQGGKPMRNEELL